MRSATHLRTEIISGHATRRAGTPAVLCVTLKENDTDSYGPRGGDKDRYYPVVLGEEV